MLVCGMNVVGKALVALALVVGLAFVAGGGFLIVERETGARARARVTDCVQVYRGTDCTGTWVVGGSLVGGGGHVVAGPVDGAVSGDLGKTIDVTVSGDHAYTRSLGLPILLICLGLPLVALCTLALIRAVKRR
jgi:hypothetical protein